MFRIHEIRLSLGEPKDRIPEKIAAVCGLEKEGCRVADWRVVRESVDARDKSRIRLVYSVDFSLERPGTGELPETEILRVLNAQKRGGALELAPSGQYSFSGADDGRGSFSGLPPVIAGFGPCGMFAALVLAECGFKPVVLERGKPVEERISDVNRFWRDGVLDPESNVQFGEGGAGTFSDGKLTTGIRDPRVGKVLEEFVRAGGGADLLYRQAPHMGTDVLRNVVKNIREKIIADGGTVLFRHKLTGLRFEKGTRKTVFAESPEGRREMPADALVIAIGHSARDTFAMLSAQGIAMEQKPFSIGLRIEHPQSLINAAQYGENFNKVYGMPPQEAGLPPAAYKLAHRCKDGRGFYTFCMCPGGSVIAAASQEGGTVTNGMSDRARGAAFANSALLADVRTEDFGSDDPLAGIAFQEHYERLAFALGGGSYKPPQETVGEFLRGRGSLAGCLPDFAAAAIREGLPVFGRKLKGFASEDARLYGVESRSSSPVRILRDAGLNASAEGVYPGGEGAGYAGGIVSAAVDGIRIAERIMARGS